LIWNYTKEDIRKVKGDSWVSIYELKVVLTVPAIWSHSAKDRTERVARAAGLPDNLSLVTEPEAAALAVLKDVKNEGTSLGVCIFEIGRMATYLYDI
jgi:molecular chaperone DnaK (HSP70)